jgi:D-alanyl-lipoteichoic acid acyltransferase DltB (MBOAT superfamily)
LFVSFFPLLVAGPIERATHLLPQVEKRRIFNYEKATDGLRQILWGLVKKIIIADSCANYANIVFNNSDHYSGASLVMGALMFAFQIYGDFSGYSDMALGTARLFGFELLQNFSFPYFSRDIAEFWRRWHISLSSWFKDYLYFPLGGSKGGNWMRARNTFIIFLVSGFWHGANWTFIVWGGLNALFIMPSIIFKTNRNNIAIVAPGKLLPSFKEFISIIITFTLTVFAWIFFRSNTLTQAFGYISHIFTKALFYSPKANTYSKNILMFIALFIFIEWIGRENKYAIEHLNKVFKNKGLRWVAYLVITVTILKFIADTTGKANEFIYFQF